jgi:hypothetical protein
VAADIPALSASQITSGVLAINQLPVGTTSTTVTAGNDSRLHTRNTDTGTDSASFQISMLAGGARLKNEVGLISVRNAADTSDADLRVRNLITTGTSTQINTTELTVADNLITLNSDYAGSAPSENAGIEVNRGTLSKAVVRWDESDDAWKIGTDTSVTKVARLYNVAFLATDLVSGVLTITHNLNSEAVGWSVYLSDNRSFMPDATLVSNNILSLNFGSNANFAGKVVIYG